MTQPLENEVCEKCGKEADLLERVCIGHKNEDPRRPILKVYCEKCELEFYKARYYCNQNVQP